MLERAFVVITMVLGGAAGATIVSLSAGEEGTTAILVPAAAVLGCAR